MKPVSESIKFAIDTNIVSAFFKGEPDIGARVREAQQVYLPIIVLAELYFGAEKSPDPERKRQQIDRFLPLVEVLQTTAQTARKYGVIKAELEARGERIPARMKNKTSITLLTRHEAKDSGVDGGRSCRGVPRRLRKGSGSHQIVRRGEKSARDDKE